MHTEKQIWSRNALPLILNAYKSSPSPVGLFSTPLPLPGESWNTRGDPGFDQDPGSPEVWGPDATFGSLSPKLWTGDLFFYGHLWEGGGVRYVDRQQTPPCLGFQFGTVLTKAWTFTHWEPRLPRSLWWWVETGGGVSSPQQTFAEFDTIWDTKSSPPPKEDHWSSCNFWKKKNPLRASTQFTIREVVEEGGCRGLCPCVDPPLSNQLKHVKSKLRTTIPFDQITPRPRVGQNTAICVLLHRLADKCSK